MDCWIVYDEERLVGNGFFVQKLTEELSAFSISARPVMETEAYSLAEKGIVPAFAVMRTFSARLSNKLTACQIPAFNNCLTQQIAGDKWLTFLFARANGIAVMPTAVYNGGTPFDYPTVIKSRYGHGGKDVFLVRSAKEQFGTACTFDDKFIVQQAASDLGKDLRVYVIGGKAVVAMLRRSQTDFRSNYKLGGTATQLQPPPQVAAVAERVSALLQADYVGVDFIFHDGQPVLNEIEDIVGCRMVYENTSLDLLKLYAGHIASLMGQK